jgi:hypothetical protein
VIRQIFDWADGGMGLGFDYDRFERLFLGLFDENLRPLLAALARPPARPTQLPSSAHDGAALGAPAALGVLEFKNDVPVPVMCGMMWAQVWAYSIDQR